MSDTLTTEEKEYFQKVSTYLHRRHGVSLKTAQAAFAEIEADKEIGMKYLRERLPQINKYRDTIQKIYDHPVITWPNKPRLLQLENEEESLEHQIKDLFASIIQDVSKNREKQIGTELENVASTLKKFEKIIAAYEKEIQSLEKAA
jgi:hypothetical protein